MTMHNVLTAHLLRPGQRVGVCGFRNGFTYATVTEVQRETSTLGAPYATLGVELPDGEVTYLDTRSHVFVSEEFTELAWCPECKRTREVEEYSDEGHMEARGEVGYRVTRFECGHTTQGPASVVAAAPGAPYAGPQVAVAASLHPRDVRAARARQDAIDHPYGQEWDL